MVRKKKEPNRIDAMLDDLLADCEGPEDILGESGMLKQLSQRLVVRVKAVAAVDRGERKSHVARVFQISRNTLDLWLRHREQTGSVEPVRDVVRGQMG